MKDYESQVYLDTKTPANGTISQSKEESINFEQLQGDVELAGKMLHDLPSEIQQYDKRGNVIHLPKLDLDGTKATEFTDAKGNKREPKLSEAFNEMKTRFNLCRIDGRVAVYDIKQKRYRTDRAGFDDILDRYICEDYKEPHHNELFAKACYSSRLEDYTSAPPWYFQFENCIVNVKTLDIYEPSPAFFIPVAYFPYDYDPAAHFPLLENAMKKWACDRPEIEQNFNELIAHMMHPKASKKEVILYNTDRRQNAQGGKSTMMETFLRVIIGTNLVNFEDRATYFTSKQLADERLRGFLACSQCNFSDENEQPSKADERKSSANFYKKVATGDPVQARPPYYKTPIYIQPYTQLVSACNELDRLEWDDGSIRRRKFIPCNAYITPQDPDYDPDIKDKLNNVLTCQTLANIGIQTLHEMYKKNVFGYTETEDDKRMMKEAEKADTRLLQWLDDMQLSAAVLAYRGEIYPFAKIDNDTALREELEHSFSGSIDDRRVMEMSDWYKFFKAYIKVYGGECGSFALFKTNVANKLHLFPHKNTSVTIREAAKDKKVNRQMFAFKNDLDKPVHSCEVCDQYGKLEHGRGEEAASDFAAMRGFFAYNKQADKIAQKIKDAGFEIPPAADGETVIFEQPAADLPPVLDGISPSEIVTTTPAA